jgi:hypothetical protein
MTYSKWRRRESNEETNSSNDECDNNLQQGEVAGAASWECCPFTHCRNLSQLDTGAVEDVTAIAIAWPSLLPRIREAIISLATLA